MRVLSPGVRPEKGCVVTVGAFDGVHAGHRSLIEQTRRQADELGAASAVVTFDRHPASVVRPESCPRLLTDLDQKIELLAQTGLDYTMVLPFDEGRASETADEFIDEVLVERLGARAVVVGYDFHFGKGRRGNADLLRVRGVDAGFTVSEVDAVGDRVPVSSTAIRNLLIEGDVAGATVLLGHPHEVRGLVLMGDGRGRELGYPTANVHVPEEIQLPASGVYAGRYVLPDGSSRTAAISLGTRPTFYADGVNLLEAHLLDFDGDLYGQHARVQFTAKVRDQVRFESVEELVVQMDSDVAGVRACV